MQVMLHVRQEAARVLRRHLFTSPASAELDNKAQKLGVTSRSLRARSENSPSASTVKPEAEGGATAERIIEELRDRDAVEAAHFVPSDELP